MITFKAIVGIVFSFILLMLLRMLFVAKERNVKRHQVKIKSHAENLRQLKVFFISDIHKRKIDQKLLKKINTSVEMVIIGGDLAEKDVPLSRISENIKQLSTLGPVFFVWGNNDREVGEENVREIMKKYHVTILDNENQGIPNHPSWGIAGTDDPSWRLANPEKALTNIEKYQHVLFVSHQPVVWGKVEKIYKPIFMLAGHTHGGQIRLGKFGIGEKGFLKEENNRWKLISNGYGTTKIPCRFGAHPECHLIEILYDESLLEEKRCKKEK